MKLTFILRYLFLLFLGLFAFDILYYIFTPLTSLPSFFIIKLFYPSAIMSSLTKFNILGDQILLVEACIAGAAYFFLLILNLSTPMRLKKRYMSLIFLIFGFLIANILRIAVFSILYLEKFVYFDFAHASVWYFGSTLFVVALWFINVKIFKIEEIPIYSDFKSLFAIAFNIKKKK